VADEGRGEDHRSAAVLLHFGDLMLGAEEGTGEVGRERIVPAGFPDPRRWTGLADRARIVEGDIEPAVLPDGEGHRFAARRLDFGDQPVEFLLAPGADAAPYN